ncbi:MAG: hypothetical protein NVS4B11_28320 [Ktedonobacteraceae bacterium]
MPQFRSLPSFEHAVVVGPMEEQVASLAFPAPTLSSLVPFSLQGQNQQLPTTDALSPVSQPLHDIPTTQSLLVALQATTLAPKKTDQLIVIPGSNKRTRVLAETQMPVRRMRKRTRHGIALATVLFVLILTMLSLAPLDGGQSTFHIFGGVIKWADAQQQDWSILAHTDTTNTQHNLTTPPIAIVAGNPPSITLPTNQYVALARQDAINAGIPPDYFVRQIYAESGFNPNANSPAGAVGIAQFEPGTAAGLGINPYDPPQALSGAARLMASYAVQYNGDYAKALAAYNAGSGNVNDAVRSCGSGWLNCVPAETRNYIYKIMGI